MIEKSYKVLEQRGDSATLDIVKGFIARRLLGFDITANDAKSFLYYQYIAPQNDTEVAETVKRIADYIYESVVEAIEENDIVGSSLDSKMYQDPSVSGAYELYPERVLNALLDNIIALYRVGIDTLSDALDNTSYFSGTDSEALLEYINIAQDAELSVRQSLESHLKNRLGNEKYPVYDFLQDMGLLERYVDNTADGSYSSFSNGEDHENIMQSVTEELLKKAHKIVYDEAIVELKEQIYFQTGIKDRTKLFHSNLNLNVSGYNIEVDFTTEDIDSDLNPELDFFSDGTVTIGALSHNLNRERFNSVFLGQISHAAITNGLKNPVAVRFFLIPSLANNTHDVMTGIESRDYYFNKSSKLRKVEPVFVAIERFNFPASVTRKNISIVCKDGLLNYLNEEKQSNLSLAESMFSEIIVIPEVIVPPVRGGTRGDAFNTNINSYRNLSYNSRGKDATFIVPKTIYRKRGSGASLDLYSKQLLETYINVDPDAASAVMCVNNDNNAIFIHGARTVDFRPAAYQIEPLKKVYSYFSRLYADSFEHCDKEYFLKKSAADDDDTIGFTARCELYSSSTLPFMPLVIDYKLSEEELYTALRLNTNNSVVHNIVKNENYGISLPTATFDYTSLHPAYSIRPNQQAVPLSAIHEMISSRHDNFLSIVNKRQVNTKRAYFDDSRATTTIVSYLTEEVEKLKLLFIYLGYSVDVKSPAKSDKYYEITVKQAKGQNLIATYYKAYYFNLVSGRFDEHTHKETNILVVNPILAVIDAFNMSEKASTETEETLRDFILKDLPSLVIDDNLILNPPIITNRSFASLESFVAYAPVLEMMDEYTRTITKPMAMLYAALNIIEYNKSRANPFVKDGDFIGSILVKGSNTVSAYIQALNNIRIGAGDMEHISDPEKTLLIDIGEELLDKEIKSLGTQGAQFKELQIKSILVMVNRLYPNNERGGLYAPLKEGISPKGLSSNFGSPLRARIESIANSIKSVQLYGIAAYKNEVVYDLFEDNKYVLTDYDFAAQISMYGLFRVFSKSVIPILSNWNSGYFNKDFTQRVKGFVGSKKDSSLVDLSSIFETFYCADALRKIWANRNKSIKLASGKKVPLNKFVTDKKGMPYSIIEEILAAFNGVAKEKTSVYQLQYVMVLEVLAQTYESVFASRDSSKVYGNIVAVSKYAALHVLTKDSGKAAIKKGMQTMSAKGGSICIGQENFGFVEQTARGNTETYTLLRHIEGQDEYLLAGVITVSLPQSGMMEEEPYPTISEAKGYNNQFIGSTFDNMISSNSGYSTIAKGLGVQAVFDIANALLIAIYFASEGHKKPKDTYSASDIIDFYSQSQFLPDDVYNRSDKIEEFWKSAFGEATAILTIAVILSKYVESPLLLLDDESQNILYEIAGRPSITLRAEELNFDNISVMTPSSMMPELSDDDY